MALRLKKAGGKKPVSKNPEVVFCGEILPRPIRRRVAIPAKAVEELLPRYRKKQKVREFASFLMELEQSPISAAFSHPVFAIRLSKRIERIKEKRYSVITGEQIHEACKREDVAGAIQEALSKKHGSHASVEDAHFKLTGKWARMVDGCKHYWLFSSFVPVYEFGIRKFFGFVPPPGITPKTVIQIAFAGAAFLTACIVASFSLNERTQRTKINRKQSE